MTAPHSIFKEGGMIMQDFNVNKENLLIALHFREYRISNIVQHTAERRSIDLMLA